jgi:hypothetical protein
MGAFLGGLAGGAAAGLAAKEKGGSLVDRFKKAIGKGGSRYSQEAMEPLPEGQEGPVIPSRVVREPLPEKRKGGRINKTGAYKLHKGEVVIPSEIVSKVQRLTKARKPSRKASRR